MHLSLDTPNLVPQAVQFAIFDTDPVPAFQASLKKLKTYHQAELERAEGEKKRNQIRRSFLEVHWNMGFRAITGDRVNLLISAPDVTQSIVANSKQGKKWLVTKTRYLNKELICWCVPFEVKAGEKNEIVVSEQNAFDLEAAYKEVMSASN